MEKIIFATHNENKLFEVKKILPTNMELLSLNNINILEEIPEEKNTLEGNAEQKAEFVYQKLKKNVFADDTGLEVEALGMLPGVFSARYAGEEKKPDANRKKLLKALENETNRKAQFRTIICLIINNKKYFFEGKVEGEILKKEQGEKGFGYDPIFMPKGYNMSFAQMPIEVKNKISHRAKAVQKLISFLNNKIF